MAELVDALVSGTSVARRGGSSPLPGTNIARKAVQSLGVGRLLLFPIPLSVPFSAEAINLILRPALAFDGHRCLGARFACPVPRFVEAQNVHGMAPAMPRPLSDPGAPTNRSSAAWFWVSSMKMDHVHIRGRCVSTGSRQINLRKPRKQFSPHGNFWGDKLPPWSR